MVVTHLVTRSAFSENNILFISKTPTDRGWGCGGPNPPLEGDLVAATSTFEELARLLCPARLNPNSRDRRRSYTDHPASP